MSRMISRISFLLLTGCLCVHLGIADTSRPTNHSQTPLYGSSGRPLESDIAEAATVGCALEASLGAVARLYAPVIQDMLWDQGNGSVSAKYHLTNGSVVSTVAQKNDFNITYLTDDSPVCWIAAIQKTLEQFAAQTGFEHDQQHGKYSPVDVFNAIFGPSANTAMNLCDSIGFDAISAFQWPMVMATNSVDGELLTNHSYTVHTGNLTHITLRNPWGIIKANSWGLPFNGSATIVNLGDGTFQIPITSVQQQCESIQWVVPLQTISYVPGRRKYRLE